MPQINSHKPTVKVVVIENKLVKKYFLGTSGILIHLPGSNLQPRTCMLPVLKWLPSTLLMKLSTDGRYNKKGRNKQKYIKCIFACFYII